ncbi:glycosyltransferase [Brucella intermedia]|uniref:glycosyltransferase n=1 Tax=Brucella intermedia TaxID=94625 RepID=UPI0015910AD8|nr:glycosyltransferase [Brucella intermedia]
MSIKKFGIYLSYSPIVDLRAEGLGRHLAMFMKGAVTDPNLRMIIACPSWSRQNLHELFEEFNIPTTSYEIIGPEKSSLLWSTVDYFRKLKSQLRKKKQRLTTKRGRLSRLVKKVKGLAASLIRLIIRSRNPLVFIPAVLLGIVALPFLGLAAAILWAVRRFLRLFRRPVNGVVSRSRSVLSRVKGLVGKFGRYVYNIAVDEEASIVVKHANKRTDIPVWYCPTSFWPQVNKIKAPTLICVPDVVPVFFPVGFSRQGGVHMFNGYKAIEKTIRGGKHFVTYSDEIKNTTLVKRFGVNGDAVHVVRHGVSSLDHLTTVSGFPDNEKAADTMCSQYLASALTKVTNNWHGSRFASANLAYLFYASQFRPNKNVLTLLKAYKWLRREKLLHLKLLLTGNIHDDPSVRAYIEKHELNDDVLCLRRITEKELAAVYYKAELAVNPSLSEGGTPFTLSEALSVNTPAVMADIPVTKETVTDPVLYEMTTFNGLDWRSLADKILWALENRSDLLAAQRGFYQSVLKQRNWQHVARDHLDILESIALKHGGNRNG